jgi:PAS domain S-box-containing protein
MEELQATQEEMERAQKDREDKENIFNKSNMLVELDDKFNVTYINQLFCDVLRFDYQDVSGKPFESIISDKDVFTGGKAKLSKGDAWASILNVKTKTNKELKVKASGGVVYDTSNRINKFMFILTDISAQ